MRYSRYAILIFLLFSCLTAFSQTVVVTSRADSGPGTLRQALLDIPAVRTNPYIINFNLLGDMSNEANRTIRLRTQLPGIPSNVTIDGSSQIGAATLGVSGAKIIIEPEDPSMTPLFTSCFTIGNITTTTEVQTSNVEIYGLYIKDFARITNIQNTNIQGSGIIIDARAKNIKIGAPGKGNVISGNQNGISIRYVTNYFNTQPLTDISIRSNIIGLHYDGLTAKSNFNGINAIDFRDGSITIGGDNAGDGNVISANKINVDIKRSFSGNARFSLNIVNNKVGTDHTGTTDFHDIFSVPSAVEISGVKVDAFNTDLYVRDNLISGNRTTGLSITNADFIITGNSIGTGKQGSEVLGNGIGIKIETGAIGFIGGDTDAKANRIANNEFGIESLSAKPVTITRNSMYCNKESGIGITRNIAQPYVQILIARAGFLSGKATRNSTIELFYTENCRGLCEGKEYFATVPTGSDGRWTYPGPININRKVTATATVLNLTTSPFSTAEVLDDEIVIEPVTCNGDGSIKVPELREGITFKWNKVLGDGTRIDLGSGQEILNLKEGFYELITNDGCREIKKVPLLEIKDQKLTDLVVNWPAPQCGQTSFTFSASVQRGKGAKIFQWLDQSGTVVRTGETVTMGPGTYKLVVRDEALCELSEQGPEIKVRPTPTIISSVSPTPARCGFPDGAITGLTIGTPTGTVTYKWNIYNPMVPPYIGAEVGQQLELNGVEGGQYILTVTDQGTCSPVTRTFTIPIIKSVIISTGQTTRATCNKSNGSIFGVTITEANYIQWLSPSGAILVEGTYSPGQSLLLKDLAPGTYTLKAHNTFTGCNDSRTFQVDQTLPTIYSLTERISNATCGLDNGRINLVFTTANPRRFEWRDDNGNILSNGTVQEIKDLPKGSYRYFTYDDNNCVLEFGPFVVDRIQELAIIPGSGIATNDGCSLSRGTVKGVKYNGGVEPYSFEWVNEAGTSVYAGPTPDLIGVPAGKYKMILRDATSCGRKESPDYYTVENPSFPIAIPVANDLRVCYATEIMVKVLAPEEGTYQLYQNANDATPTMENANGVFVFKVSKTGDYVIRRKLGTCYSDFSPLHIEVTNDNLEIKNTMTPNGDGMNDFWMISGLPDHADINIKIYTRSGQLVYESVGPYNKPFDGRFRGKDLPAGAYYYRIDLRADCKPIAGSITLLR